MKNFFSFKMNAQNTEKKLWIQIIKVAIIVGICLIASFAVSELVQDRIQRNERAVESVGGLPELTINSNVFVRENVDEYRGDGSTQVVRSQFEHSVFNNTVIDVAEITYKKLGKQNIPVLKGHSTSTGSFKEFTDDTFYQFSASASQLKKNNPELEIPVPEGAENVALSIDGRLIEDYKKSDRSNLIILPATTLRNLKATSTISLSYDFTALAKIKTRYESGGDHKVQINTHTSNIRLLNSFNSMFDKDTMTAVLDIHAGDYQTSGVAFLSGADDITLVDRILKYAVLFIVLVFSLAVFMDIRKGFVVNTLQYFLVGASLALFYLLTLALGEEIGYTYAYIIGAVGTAVLNMWFVGGIFNSKKIGYVFATVLLALYGALYVIVRLDSISLLLGTGLLYAVLIAFMMAAKKSNRIS